MYDYGTLIPPLDASHSSLLPRSSVFGIIVIIIIITNIVIVIIILIILILLIFYYYPHCRWRGWRL